jgi:hypothetical protein
MFKINDILTLKLRKTYRRALCHPLKKFELLAGIIKVEN